MQIFFPKESNESDENYATRYNKFILSIKKDQKYAGDFEISSAYILLNTRILIYTFNINSYKLINVYSPNEDKK